ncbi:hypothetical protein HK405_007078, partial [Cladochytrium tenue]
MAPGGGGGSADTLHSAATDATAAADLHVVPSPAPWSASASHAGDARLPLAAVAAAVAAGVSRSRRQNDDDEDDYYDEDDGDSHRRHQHHNCSRRHRHLLYSNVVDSRAFGARRGGDVLWSRPPGGAAPLLRLKPSTLDLGLALSLPLPSPPTTPSSPAALETVPLLPVLAACKQPPQLALAHTHGPPQPPPPPQAVLARTAQPAAAATHTNAAAAAAASTPLLVWPHEFFLGARPLPWSAAVDDENARHLQRQSPPHAGRPPRAITAPTIPTAAAATAPQVYKPNTACHGAGGSGVAAAAMRCPLAPRVSSAFERIAPAAPPPHASRAATAGYGDGGCGAQAPLQKQQQQQQQQQWRRSRGTHHGRTGPAIDTATPTSHGLRYLVPSITFATAPTPGGRDGSSGTVWRSVGARLRLRDNGGGSSGGDGCKSADVSQRAAEAVEIAPPAHPDEAAAVRRPPRRCAVPLSAVLRPAAVAVGRAKHDGLQAGRGSPGQPPGSRVVVFKMGQRGWATDDAEEGTVPAVAEKDEQQEDGAVRSERGSGGANDHNVDDGRCRPEAVGPDGWAADATAGETLEGAGGTQALRYRRSKQRRRQQQRETQQHLSHGSQVCAVPVVEVGGTEVWCTAATAGPGRVKIGDGGGGACTAATSAARSKIPTGRATPVTTTVYSHVSGRSPLQPPPVVQRARTPAAGLLHVRTLEAPATAAMVTAVAATRGAQHVRRLVAAAAAGSRDVATAPGSYSATATGCVAGVSVVEAVAAAGRLQMALGPACAMPQQRRRQRRRPGSLDSVWAAGGAGWSLGGAGGAGDDGDWSWGWPAAASKAEAAADKRGWPERGEFEEGDRVGEEDTDAGEWADGGGGGDDDGGWSARSSRATTGRSSLLVAASEDGGTSDYGGNERLTVILTRPDDERAESTLPSLTVQVPQSERHEADVAAYGPTTAAGWSWPGGGGGSDVVDDGGGNHSGFPEPARSATTAEASAAAGDTAPAPVFVVTIEATAAEEEEQKQPGREAGLGAAQRSQRLQRRRSVSVGSLGATAAATATAAVTAATAAAAVTGGIGSGLAADAFGRGGRRRSVVMLRAPEDDDGGSGSGDTGGTRLRPTSATGSRARPRSAARGAGGGAPTPQGVAGAATADVERHGNALPLLQAAPHGSSVSSLRRSGSRAWANGSSLNLTGGGGGGSQLLRRSGSVMGSTAAFGGGGGGGGGSERRRASKLGAALAMVAFTDRESGATVTNMVELPWRRRKRPPIWLENVLKHSLLIYIAVRRIQR